MRILISYVLQAICIGSFIYLFAMVFYDIGRNVEAVEIISLWFASAAIGAAGMIHHTNLPEILKYGVQIGVGIIAFTAVNIYHGWLSVSFLEIMDYVMFIVIVMLIIFLVNYLLSVRNSKMINQFLKNKE